MRTIFNTISLITLVLAFAIIVTVGYWMLYPYKPIVFRTTTLPVLTKSAKAGTPIQIQIDYCKYMPLQSTVETQFVDSLIYAAPVITTNNPTGCHSTVALITVPEGLPPESYHMIRTYSYQVNPIRKVSIVINTENFMVVK